jgi:dienelactone hydrolase
MIIVSEGWENNEKNVILPPVFSYFRYSMSKNNYISIFVMLFLMVIVTSCHKSDTSQLSPEDYFTTIVNDKELIVRVDDVRSGSISGTYYYTDCLLAEPHSFSVTIKPTGAKLKMENMKKTANIKWEMQENGIKVSCKSPRLPQKIELIRHEIDSSVFHNALCEPSYEYNLTPATKMYASAVGYWTSYPDTDDPMSKILMDLYTEHMEDLKNPKEQVLLMDIYEPKDDNTQARHPLILFIHGGAFLNGDKADEPYKKWCQHFASLGYVAVSLNYRMGFLPYRKAIDCAGYRATQDANAALRYLVNHADLYHIDPDLIFTWGTSAGAITALNVAFMNNSSRPPSVEGEGDIDKLAPECPNTFHVRAVANMWGAVHDTAILANSNTAVISFHSDGDDIVPYRLGHPFREKLVNSATNSLNDIVCDIFGFLGASSSTTNSIRDKGRAAVKKVRDLAEPITEPAWNLVISPMYGSAPIHEYLTRHGVRSKLLTEHKPNVHSLHVDEHRNICPYFYTIQDSVAQFFFSELVPNPVLLEQDNQQQQLFRIENDNVKEAHWQAEGGFVLKSSDNCAKVVFFKDAVRHVVRVCGKYKNGVEFCKEMAI